MKKQRVHGVKNIFNSRYQEEISHYGQTILAAAKRVLTTIRSTRSIALRGSDMSAGTQILEFSH